MLGVAADLATELAAQLGGEGRVIALALPLPLWIGTALLLYRFVPAAGLRLQDALAGAVVTAAILLAISLASDLVYAKTTDWSVIYGSLASLLVFLYSVYLSAATLLLGAAVAAEWSLPHEPAGVPCGNRGSGLFMRARR